MEYYHKAYTIQSIYFFVIKKGDDINNCRPKIIEKDTQEYKDINEEFRIIIRNQLVVSHLFYHLWSIYAHCHVSLNICINF